MISLQDVTLQRGPKILLEHASLVIHPGQRVAIIGANGCGKTSLFKLLLAELHVDSGELTIPAAWRIAHMAQEVATAERLAVDYVMDGDHVLRQLEQDMVAAETAGDDNRLAELHGKMDVIAGYDARYRAEQLLHGLGFTQAQTTQPANHFSGGWRIRLNLAQALMCPSDLLLLDEPTNHLDLDATFWLEQWLKNYTGTLVLISHDRDFIDSVASMIVHIEHQKCWAYKGHYSAFEKRRAERLAQQQASYEKQLQRKKEIEGFVNRFRAQATKAKQAQSRLKELQRMEDIAPAHVDSPFHFHFFEAKKCFSALVRLRKANLGYGEASILENVNIELQPGSRIGLLGPNGAGKSTLIKSLTSSLALLSGERICGEHLHIGYFAQHQLEALDVQASALLHIQRLSPQAKEQEIRNFLGGFNFHGDKALEVIEDFSGGEKARLALALIVWQKPNLLLLDEPTNHLDIEMRHALTEAIQGYEGALIVISHDRHLLRNTVDELYLVANGKVEAFDGDLQDYQNWLKNDSKDNKNSGGEVVNRGSVVNDATDKKSSADKKDLRKKNAERRQQLAPITKKIRHIEKSLEKQQAQLTMLDDKLSDSALYEGDKKNDLKRILSEQVDSKKKVDQLEVEWISLNEELEIAERQVD